MFIFVSYYIHIIIDCQYVPYEVHKVSRLLWEIPLKININWKIYKMVSEWQGSVQEKGLNILYYLEKL